MMSGLPPRGLHARLACFHCRRSKRRCDKVLPRCNICTHNGFECSYPTRRGEQSRDNSTGPEGLSTHNGHSGGSFHSSPGEPDATSSGAAFAAAVNFIAPEVFHQAQLALLLPDTPVPADVAAHIGDADSIRNVAAMFFRTIHTWLPIISKKRFYSFVLNPLSQRGPERSLLVLCMKLCCSPRPSEGDARSALYRAAKRFYFEVEASGLLSIHVMQAGLLIAVYEMGQAIYPAAFLTVGACARYGMALGIQTLSQDGAGDAARQRSWLEVEEMRRAWWAVLLLDRLLNIPNPNRQLSTDDPSFDIYLPVDDKAWDQGITCPGDAVRLSAGFELKMGLFARLAQATYLVSQALKATSLSASGTPSAEDTAQLRRTIFALVQAAGTEAELRQLEYCPQSSICFSAILLLQYHTAQTQPLDTDETREHLFPETEFAIEDISSMAAKLCVEWDNKGEDDEACEDRISLFLMQVIYQAASTLTRLSRGSPDSAARERIDALEGLLRRLSDRWGVAGVYLSILASEQATAAMAAI